jgi:hypothetical protein
MAFMICPFSRRTSGTGRHSSHVLTVHGQEAPVATLTVSRRRAAVRVPQGAFMLTNKSFMAYKYQYPDGRVFMTQKFLWGKSELEFDGSRYTTNVDVSGPIFRPAVIQGRIYQDGSPVLELDAEQGPAGWRRMFKENGPVDGTLSTHIDDPLTIAAFMLALQHCLEWEAFGE